MKLKRRTFLKKSALLPAAVTLGASLFNKNLVFATDGSGSTSCNSYCKLDGTGVAIPANYSSLSLLEKYQAMINFLGATTEENLDPTVADGVLTNVVYTETREHSVSGQKCADVPELMYVCEWPIKLYLVDKDPGTTWILLGTSVAQALFLYCPEDSSMTLSANFDIAIPASLGYEYSVATHGIIPLIDFTGNPTCYGEDY